jgi:hypothetical protein
VVERLHGNKAFWKKFYQKEPYSKRPRVQFPLGASPFWDIDISKILESYKINFIYDVELEGKTRVSDDLFCIILSMMLGILTRCLYVYSTIYYYMSSRNRLGSKIHDQLAGLVLYFVILFLSRKLNDLFCII